MTTRRTLDTRKLAPHWSLSLPMTCALLLAFTAAPLRAQSYHDLYDFNCTGNTGCEPADSGYLTRATDGYLYGTTLFGGDNNLGTIFKILPNGTGFDALWQFDGTPTGSNPSAALTLATADGNFYGTADIGGSFGSGTLFRFDPSASPITLTVLHNFTTAEGSPVSPPVEAKDQNLYGVTVTGTTYRVTPSTGTYTPLPNNAFGGSDAPLFLASDGNLYGTSTAGGSNNKGTIFRMTTAGALQIVHSFKGGDGARPIAPLSQDKSGNLYGTTFAGDSNNGGTAFELALKPVQLTTLEAFDGLGGDGAGPWTGLLAATDGNFYGSTALAGANDFGNLYEISGGSFFDLYDFTGPGGIVSGGGPKTTLMENTDGAFYGLTSEGGADGSGVFYSLAPSTPVINITWCCNRFVILDQPVRILGDNLLQVISVTFGSVEAQFRPGSDTYLTALVPSGALDGPIIVTMATGLQVESQQSAQILPRIINLDPSGGSVGSQVAIVGGGFAGTTKVTFGGVAATNYTVVTPALIQATVPTGAKTGKVGVFTPNGSAKSRQTFTVH